MRFESPFSFSVIAVITAVSVFAVIYNFTGVVKQPYFSEYVSHGIEEAQLYLGGSGRLRASSTFLASSERARATFMKKVESELLKGKDPSALPLSGWVGKMWFALWNVFTPIYSCPHVLNRIGTLVDGGKWVCGIDVFEDTKRDPCIVYSFGVGGDSSFEIEFVKRTNCTVYGFDHTKDKMVLPSDLDPKLAERIHFQKTGIGSKAEVKTNSKLNTLKGIMDQNGHTWIDFLKMDIERHEFAVLKDVAEDFQVYPFGHFNLEVHLTKGDKLKTMYDLWTTLEKGGLRSFMWEPNFVMQFRNNPFLWEFSYINVVDSRSRLLRF